MISAARSFSRDSAAELFPVLAHDKASKLFFAEENSLGFGFVCQPLYGLDDKTGDRINVLLNLAWPVGTMLQFMLYASPDVERQLATYESLTHADTSDLLSSIRSERAEFLRTKTVEALSETASGGLLLRDIKLLITAKIPVRDIPPSDKDLMEAVKLRETVEQNLSTAGFVNSPLDAVGYIRFMQTVLNQSPNASWRSTLGEYDDSMLIRDQIMDYDTDIVLTKHHIEVGDSVIKTFGIKRYPRHGIVGLAARFLMEPSTGARGITDNVLLTATVYFPDNEAMRSESARKRQWVTNQAYGPMLKFVPRLAGMKMSFDALWKAIDEGDRIIQVALTMTLITPKEREQAATSNAITYWRENGFQLMEDVFVNMPTFLSGLPFGPESSCVRDSFRYRTMATRHAITLLPVMGNWKGTGNPIFTLVGRDGQLMSLDAFQSGSNYNSVVAAKSGSGKSFFMNEVIMSYMSAAGRCWVIDVGRSYEKLCDHLGGQFMEFGPESKICLNPFDLVTSEAEYEESVDMLVGIIANMAAPNDKLDDLQTPELRRILREAWDEHRSELTIDLLAERLKRHEDSRVSDIGRQLYPFTTKGEYGKFFNGRNTMRFDSGFVVLELEELKSRTHLQQVVLLQLIFQIQQEMYLGQRDKRKLVIIDEAWSLLTSGDVGKFIETGYRRFRKYGGSAWVITQSLGDLYNSPGGIAIAENSTNKYLLAQNSETISMLQREKRLDLGEFGFDLLKSVHTIPGQYSEVFCMTEGGIGVGRLYVPPFLLLLYSTKAEDVHQINEVAKQRGCSLSEAIRDILDQRGHR